MDHDKTEQTQPEAPHTPDPQLDAAAHGDPMAVALASEVAKEEERHPATAAALEARAARASREQLVDALLGLLAAGRHAQLCPAGSHHLQTCACGWGSAETDAKAALVGEPEA